MVRNINQWSIFYDTSIVLICIEIWKKSELPRIVELVGRGNVQLMNPVRGGSSPDGGKQS